MRAGIIPVYVRRPSPLHSARAGVTTSFCAALALVCGLYESPYVLAAVAAAVVGAGVAAGVGSEIRRSARLAIPLAILIAIVNPLVYTEGNTLLIRGDAVLGHRFDITLEAVVAGGLAGLRIAVLVMVFGLFSACVDPDELLRMMRRFSYRSALTAALTTRLVPVLVRDASRMSDAARCRPTPPGRAAVARSALAGALDRAVEVAAALEVRGYSAAPAKQRGRARRRAFSRHDRSVTAAAALIAIAAIAAKAAGAGDVDPYPDVEIAHGALVQALSFVIALATAIPFAGRSARLGVARV